jgi:hypothetical protein
MVPAASVTVDVASPLPAAPGCVLDCGQDVGLCTVEEIDDEEVAGQDRLGLGAQEL